jgi:hypothetical protein
MFTHFCGFEVWSFGWGVSLQCIHTHVFLEQKFSTIDPFFFLLLLFLLFFFLVIIELKNNYYGNWYNNLLD